MRRIRYELTAFAAGVVFAFGLVLGGMTDPLRVIAFLDVAGAWNPSLAFVMGGAVLVYAPAWRWAKARGAPVFDRGFHLPSGRDLDTSLVVGSTMFGIGWGLSGFCPGPALVSTMTFDGAPLLFGASMLAGMAMFAGWQHAWTEARSRKRGS